jgi:hypothetical protein
VSSYKVEVFSDGEWKQVHQGKTIGYRKLDRFPKIKASKVRVTIESARACPVIRSIGVHLDSVSPAEFFQADKANMEIVRRPRPASPASQPRPQ